MKQSFLGAEVAKAARYKEWFRILRECFNDAEPSKISVREFNTGFHESQILLNEFNEIQIQMKVEESKFLKI